MENPANFEDLLTGEYQKFANFLDKLYTTQNKESITKEFIEEVRALQKFSFTNKNQFYMVFDQVKFLPLYISDNIVNISGYTSQEMYNMTLLQCLKRLSWNQIPALYKLHYYGKSFRDLNKFSDVKKHEILLCGFKWKHKKGQIRVFFIRQKFLMIDKNREPTLSFLLVENITPIYKSDSCWFHMADYSRDLPLIRVYSANGNISTQLISDRELEILRLITKKMDSTAIANQLHISVETVKKHRKNMIAKVGVKDMTGLIYICRQANLI